MWSLGLTKAYSKAEVFVLGKSVYRATAYIELERITYIYNSMQSRYNVQIYHWGINFIQGVVFFGKFGIGRGPTFGPF